MELIMPKQFFLLVTAGILLSVAHTAWAIERSASPVINAPGIDVGTNAGNGAHGMSPAVPASSLSPPRTSGIVRTAPRSAEGNGLPSSPGIRPFRPGMRTDDARFGSPLRPQMSPQGLPRSKAGHPGMRPGGPGMHPAGYDLLRKMQHQRSSRPQIRQPRPNVSRVGGRHGHR